MPGRTPPPMMSRRSSPTRNSRIIRSSERQHMELGSSSRDRDRREYRMSRSPIPPPKERPYSPQVKRKAISPVREREMSRSSKHSKSPVNSRNLEHASYSRAVEPDIVVKPTSSKRYKSDFNKEYEEDMKPVMVHNYEEKATPLFRGPEGTAEFDVHELRKFTVEIIRRPKTVVESSSINRSIVRPEEIVPVRRSDEGGMPLFMRAQSSISNERNVPPEDFRRIVARESSRESGNVRERSRERSRYSPDPYEESRNPVYSERERERSPYESRRRTPPRVEYIESRPRERRAESRDDIRRDVDVRKREERHYSPVMRTHSSYERDGDLRTRINEKRSDHSRVEVREHVSGRYESEREKHSRPHHSNSPPRERRRGGSLDRHESSRTRAEYEREKERESVKRRPHSREREERRDRYEHSDHYEERRSHSYKTEHEPKKSYKPYEQREFVPPPQRGRGLPIRPRGIPPMIRGRGMMRGINRGAFRGMPMGPMPPHGIPRGMPFMGPPRFPPRFFAPF